MGDLAEALDRLATTSPARRRAGGEGDRAFIGGADIAEMAALDRQGARDVITVLHGVCQAIRALPVPVVARLQGWTIGAGLEIAAACDLRVAAEGDAVRHAGRAHGHSRRGRGGAAAAADRLGPHPPPAADRRADRRGDRAAWGLVEEVVPPEELTRAVGAGRWRLLAGGPLAVRRQKALMAAWENLPPADAIARGIDAFAASWDSDEPRSRMQAFLAARARGGRDQATRAAGVIRRGAPRTSRQSGQAADRLLQDAPTPRRQTSAATRRRTRPSSAPRGTPPGRSE